MAGEPEPYTVRAMEMLRDGEWRDREWLVLKLIPMVPPGKAKRVAEQRRRYSSASVTRRRPVDPDREVSVGARFVISQMLGGLSFEKRKGKDGRDQVRLTANAVERMRRNSTAERSDEDSL